MTDHFTIRRRQLLKAGAAGAGFLAMGGAGLFSAGPMAQRLLGAAAAASTYIEVFPTSPVIVNPFKEDDALAAQMGPAYTGTLPIPKAATPVPGPSYWSSLSGRKKPLPAPDPATGGLQDANGAVHQYGVDKVTFKDYKRDPLVYHVRLEVGTHDFTKSQVLPINSQGQPTTSFGPGGKTFGPGTLRSLPSSVITGFNASQDGSPVGFPGPRINAKYGQPVILRFENRMSGGLNLTGQSRLDFGAPDMGFLTHLHNGHTAPESDGQPHYRCNQETIQGKLPGGNPVSNLGWGDYNSLGYTEQTWVDNMYLNFPAGNDDAEKQGLFWFHDHFHNHTGANVYKGMVGLFPIYDPSSTLRDPVTGATRTFSDIGENMPGSLGLPGEYSDNGNGTFEMKYDIPLAFYDVRLDDGVTVHQDFHANDYTASGLGGQKGWFDGDKIENDIKPGVAHPEWWGQSYFKHFPNHGFVGDIFTVNGAAFPTLHVKRRMYRFRCLDASISRIYEFKLMRASSDPVPAYKLGYQGDDLQGQYRLVNGQQCMRWVQIANGGGLLPRPIVRDSFEIWPAMRREVVVDFRTYQDGKSATRDGEVIWWVNVCKMPDGRMPTSPDPNYVVPMIKIIIDGNDIVKDARELTPDAGFVKGGQINTNAGLRQQPDLQIVDPKTNTLTGKRVPVEAAFVNGKPIPELQAMIDNGRQFTLQRGGQTDLALPNPPNDNEWGINGHSFDETINVLDQKGRETIPTQGIPEIWTVQNGGGGWVHPMHMHMEEHKILFRNGKPAATWQSGSSVDARHADDTGKDDVVLLDPSEGVMFYRNFRTFKGKYVAHCHNLAHEDHAMMFGWEIGPREYKL